jgi:hypothetical protein
MSERHPNNYEQCLMGMVFGRSLPDNDQIYIDSTFGLGTGPWTMYEEGGRLRRHRLTRTWKIYMGPVGYPSCTAKTEMPGFGPVDAVFIHELTHIWQSSHDFFPDSFMAESALCQKVAEKATGNSAACYRYKPGASWLLYNVEQQAQIVEDWYTRGMKQGSDSLWPYIRDFIRNGSNASGGRCIIRTSRDEQRVPIRTGPERRIPIRTGPQR